MKVTKIIPYMIILPLLLFTSCSKNNSFDSSGIRREANDSVIEEQAKELPDGRTGEEILCQEGPKVISLVSEEDFSSLFNLICDSSSTNELFAELIQNAYQGDGDPELKIIEASTSEHYISRLSFAYAIKVALASPSLITDLEVHNGLTDGILTENSDLALKVAERVSFPGRRSIEKVVLEYDINNAHGAAIYDVRQTAFNTYLLLENNRDVTVSTEHLVDEENEYYHSTNSLTVGLKTSKNETYLLVLNDFIIKNRIDPERLKKTIIELNAQIAAKLYSYISEKAN